MTAGEEPALEAGVENHGDSGNMGVENEAGGGDVAGMELLAGEGLRGTSEQGLDEVQAFFVAGEGGRQGEEHGKFQSIGGGLR